MAVESAIVDVNDSSFTAALLANELKNYSFNLEALRKWVITFVVCDFNVDVGVEVEYMFPSTALSAADIQTICFSSFPEKSNSDELGDSAFHFKFRHTSPDVVHEPTEDDPAQWYGYCLFRQQHDASVKRSYRQKSLILVSQHDYTTLFSHIVKEVSMLEFAVSPALIESACSNIAAWGPPQIGIKELPFLGEILEVHIPPHNCFPLQGIMSRNSSRNHLGPQIHTSEPIGSWSRLAHLLPSLPELYIIFERALLSEPLVVLADDPRTSSEFVNAVIDMIRPIPFGGECRPYLTMQSDFCPGAHDSLPLRHYLIGITNPFFLKRLLSQGKESTLAHVVYLAGPETRRRTLLSYSSLTGGTDRDHPSQMMPNETKSYIAKDQVFLRKLEALLKDPETSPQECERFVRRHFALQAALFLAPLNRYLATLTTSAPDTNVIDIASFSEEDFLASLQKYGCAISFKGKTNFLRNRTAESFYRKFCRSPSFFTWLEMKMRLQNADPDGVITPPAEKEDVVIDEEEDLASPQEV
ncbi:hypothetical protein EDC01DRAFT_639227 [Geopyxis carbonaria]|nr:hypothetical protein EDC01DRAFT_639227 [Geopyxis carbonaria]